MDSEKLIELVREHQGLYDLSHPKYSDANWKDLRWKEIGQVLNQSANTCKARWSNIRDQYKKTLNKQKTTSGQASKKLLKYKYEDQVNFLKQYFQERPTISNIEGSDSEEDNTYEFPDTNVAADTINNSDHENTANTTATSMPTHQPIQFGSRTSTNTTNVRKKKEKETASLTLMKYLLENRQRSETTTSQKDPIDAFLMGIAATMKTLDPFHANLAKSKVFTAVQEVEKQQIMHNQYLMYNPPSESNWNWTPPPVSNVQSVQNNLPNNSETCQLVSETISSDNMITRL